VSFTDNIKNIIGSIMNSALAPLSFDKHQHIKILTDQAFQHAKNQQVVPVIVHEFARAGAEMPIVFVKNSETGEFQPVALLGLKAGENVFYAEGDKKWLATYIPELISQHPFALMPTENDASQLQVILKEDSYLVSSEQGEALFDQFGDETEYMKKRKNALGHYYENTQITKAFVNTLNEKSLLIQQQLTLTLNGENFTLDGVYLVDEKALNNLPDNDFLELRQRGYLAPIYNHLSSLHQLSRIAALKAK